jgi:hypothetical protein
LYSFNAYLSIPTPVVRSDVVLEIEFARLYPAMDKLTAHRAALARHYFDCFGDVFEEKYGAQLPV